jgi:hypothetical protein
MEPEPKPDALQCDEQLGVAAAAAVKTEGDPAQAPPEAAPTAEPAQPSDEAMPSLTAEETLPPAPGEHNRVSSPSADPRRADVFFQPPSRLLPSGFPLPKERNPLVSRGECQCPSPEAGTLEACEPIPAI